MSLRDNLRAAGIEPNDPQAVLRYIALIPVPRSQRIAVLRQYEAETLKPFDPGAFARAVDGIPPA